MASIKTADQFSTCARAAKIHPKALVNSVISSGGCRSRCFKFSDPNIIQLTSSHSERAKDLSPTHQDSITIVVDYASTTLRTNPSLSVARKVLTILQHHYVETLGRGLVVNLPGILAFFYKGLSPFMDPATRDKVGVIFGWMVVRYERA